MLVDWKMVLYLGFFVLQLPSVCWYSGVAELGAYISSFSYRLRAFGEAVPKFFHRGEHDCVFQLGLVDGSEG